MRVDKALRDNQARYDHHILVIEGICGNGSNLVTLDSNIEKRYPSAYRGQSPDPTQCRTPRRPSFFLVRLFLLLV